MHKGGTLRVLIVALGAGLGGVSRYLIQGWILERTGPSILALFVINVSGAFVLGLVTRLAVERNLINPRAIASGFGANLPSFLR